MMALMAVINAINLGALFLGAVNSADKNSTSIKIF